VVNKEGVCEPTKPGCRYEDNECKNCTRPFKFENGSCTIPGCKIIANEGCKECNLPFIVDPKNLSCIVEGCATYDVDGCKECAAPFILNTDKSCKIEKCLKV
jgi:hypothetical protein